MQSLPPKLHVTRVLAIAAVSLVAGCSEPPTAEAQKNSPGLVQVAVIRASNACFTAAIRVTGFLVAREEAVVTIDLPGAKVTEVLVGEGERVNAGQVLARVTQPAPPGPPGAPGAPGGTAATTTISLKAPAAGLVTRSAAVVGATASPMQTEPLFRIAVNNEIELEAEVPSIHIPELATGQPARVEVDNRELSGRVRLVPGAVDHRTQLGRARVSLERDPRLRLGMLARATIDANRSCGISVPRSAVFYRTEGPSVQIVRDNVIETRLVQVGINSDNDIEIREGLREGDMVVSNAGSSLRDGDKVRPVVPDGTRLGQR